MALTIEQEQALLALLDEKKMTLSELPEAIDLNKEDLLLIRQGVIDKSVNNSVLKEYFNPAAASLTDPGIVKLSSAINSDDEHIAATVKAVKSVHDAALDGVSKSLSKSANLADIVDPTEALRNLGLMDVLKRGDFTSLLGDPGYIKFPGGFILQIMTVTASTSPIPINGVTGGYEFSGSVSFPLKFPQKCIGIIITPFDVSYTGAEYAVVAKSSMKNDGCSFYMGHSHSTGTGNNPTPMSGTLIAIGY